MKTQRDSKFPETSLSLYSAMKPWLFLTILIPFTPLFAEEKEDKKLNQLAGEKSPYLLEHSTNPVDH